MNVSDYMLLQKQGCRRATETDEQAWVPAARLDHLSTISGTHRVGGETDSRKLSSDLYKDTLGHKHAHSRKK